MCKKLEMTYARPMTFSLVDLQMKLVAVAAILLSAVGISFLQSVGVDAKDKLSELDRHSLLASEKDVWFDSLTESELQEKWSADDGTSIANKISALSKFEGRVLIDIRLIGFDGDGGNMNLQISEHELLKYFDSVAAGSISSESKPHVINTAPGQSHDLNLKMRHIFRVAKARKSVTASVSAAIAAYVDPHKSDLEIFVPVSAVDDLIRRDYNEHAIAAYTIYLLNPAQPKRMMATLPPNKDGTFPPNAERRAVPVKYTYLVDPAAAGTPGAAPNPGPCSTVLWVATAPNDRYAWIDLTAGPTSYGPQTSGDGIVTDFTIPRPDRKLFLPHLLSNSPASRPSGVAPSDSKKFAHDTRPDTHTIAGSAHDPDRPPMTDPSFAANSDTIISKAPKALTDVELSVREHELMAELAAIVRSSVKHLIVPSIDRFPVTYTKKVAINVVVIHDSPDAPNDPINSWANWDKRWAPAADELRSLGLVGQTVSVVTDHVVFDECELCVAAYTHSLKAHTSNVMIEGGLRTQVHRYLDSADMRDWLEHFEDSFWGIKADAKRVEGTDPTTGQMYAQRPASRLSLSPDSLLVCRG